jgi:hypothetical protein
MRGSGRGINPDVNIYDLSDDPVAYASERCELVNDLLPVLVDKYSSEASSYHEVRRAYYTLTGEYAIQLRVMTRQIGGVRYNRVGPEYIGNNKPYTPVSLVDQKAAINALSKYAFAPHAFDAQSSTYSYLQAQRRGFGFFGSNEDPRIHSRILGAQKQALSHLLHPGVLQRITDSGQYGNEYDIATYLKDLTDAVFKADLKKSVNTFRQQLQVAYVEMLISALSPKSRYDSVSRGVIISQLNRIYRQQIDGRSPNSLTRAHRGHIIHVIDRAFER